MAAGASGSTSSPNCLSWNCASSAAALPAASPAVVAVAAVAAGDSGVVDGGGCGDLEGRCEDCPAAAFHINSSGKGSPQHTAIVVWNGVTDKMMCLKALP